jgi:hypothetical protein
MRVQVPPSAPEKEKGLARRKQLTSPIRLGGTLQLFKLSIVKDVSDNLISAYPFTDLDQLAAGQRASLGFIGGIKPNSTNDAVLEHFTGLNLYSQRPAIFSRMPHRRP